MTPDMMLFIAGVMVGLVWGGMLTLVLVAWRSR